MEELRKQAIQVIVENLNIDEKEAAENLDGSINYLQELVCANDCRMSDMRSEVEGLCGFLSSTITQYISMMIREENIPEPIKERFRPIEGEEENEEEIEKENEFNPYDYVGMIGAEMCQELCEMMM